MEKVANLKNNGDHWKIEVYPKEKSMNFWN